MAETSRLGRVVMWNLTAGWGVILRADDDQQYLCAASAVEGGRLSAGQGVLFVPTMAVSGKLLAKHVRVAKPRVESDAPM